MTAGLDITPVVAQGKQVIDGYGDGAFTIGGVVHTGAVLVFPDTTLVWDVTLDPDAFDVAAFAPLVEQADGLDLVLVGCGPVFLAPPKGLRVALKDQGLVLEWMDTGAACRTFNVLLAEGRPTAAALLPV